MTTTTTMATLLAVQRRRTVHSLLANPQCCRQRFVLSRHRLS
jgi:hypothetical protein